SNQAAARAWNPNSTARPPKISTAAASAMATPGIGMPFAAENPTMCEYIAILVIPLKRKIGLIRRRPRRLVVSFGIIIRVSPFDEIRLLQVKEQTFGRVVGLDSNLGFV